MTVRNASHAEARDIAPPESQAHPPHRILVVEDDDYIRRLTTEVLLHTGYKVDTAADGAAAWHALNICSYDLMVTDNSMPKVSGVELLKKMRASHMALPVIMATGMVPAEDFTQTSWLQPVTLLLKPYTTEELVGMVQKILRETGDDGNNNPLPTASKASVKKLQRTGAAAGVSREHRINSAHHILVVDEDSDLRLLYSEALTAQGYYVAEAQDGDAGWEALQCNGYDLLITEHELPKLTGVELIRKLRAAHMSLPVLMTAGRLPVHELANNPSLQLTVTLAKPFPIEKLLDAVRNALRATDSPSEKIASPPSWQSQPSADGLQL